MAKKILGYEVASEEKQRKTALALILVTALIAGTFVFIFFMQSQVTFSGREAAMGTIVSFDTKCRYVVRNISKRVSYSDITGLVSCAEAQQVADENNNPLGSIRKITTAVVDFRTTEGKAVRSHLEYDGDASIGAQIEILYRTDDPSDLKPYADVPLFGKESINEPSPATAAAPAKPRPSDSMSDGTLMAIGLVSLVVMVAIAFFVLRLLFRTLKWLLFGSGKSKPAAATVAPSAQAPRNASQAGRPAGFGRR
jgi:hypothetical protein